MGLLARLLGIEKQTEHTSIHETNTNGDNVVGTKTQRTISVKEFVQNSASSNKFNPNRELALINIASESITLHPDKVVSTAKSIQADIIGRLPTFVRAQEIQQARQIASLRAHLSGMDFSSQSSTESEYPGVDANGKPIILSRREATHDAFKPEGTVRGEVSAYHIQVDGARVKEEHSIDLGFNTDGENGSSSNLHVYSSYEANGPDTQITGSGYSITISK